MILSLFIARRYLFAKKSHNAINIISLISVIGISIGTLAMICTLSVFNGFSTLSEMSFEDFETDLQITPVKGKAFVPSDSLLKRIVATAGVADVGQEIEEQALLVYDERQMPALVRGVDSNFSSLVSIEGRMRLGVFELQQGDMEYAVAAVGVANSLGINPQFLSPLKFYSPNRKAKVNSDPMRAFHTEYAWPGAFVSLNQMKYNTELVFVSLPFARRLFDYSDRITAWNVKVADGYSVAGVKKALAGIAGAEFAVKDRHERQADIFRMVNIEKWVTFFLLLFILLIAIFNIIGSLSILIVEKQEDIGKLRAMGAGNRLILAIFTFEGWLISLSGLFSGLLLGIVVCLAQQYFHFIPLGDSSGQFIINYYPVRVQWGDVLTVTLTVSAIGIAAVLYPVYNLRQKLKRQ